jgi:hypothetical protein
VICLPFTQALFVLPTNATAKPNWEQRKKTHTARNNSSDDVNCGNIYDPWAIK